MSEKTENKTGRKKIDPKIKYEEYKKKLSERDEKPKPYNEWIKKVPEFNPDGTPTGKTRIVPGESGETSHEVFVRLAESRVNAMLAKAERIKNLGRYDHTQEESQKIINTIQTAVNEIVAVLQSKTEEKVKFTL